MRVKWIVTGELFEHLDMDEAHLSLPVRGKDSDEFVIQQTGIILRPSARDWPDVFRLPKMQFDLIADDIYINGISRIIFTDAVEYKLTTFLYDKTGRNLLRDLNDQHFRLHHECGLRSQTSIRDTITHSYEPS